MPLETTEKMLATAVKAMGGQERAGQVEMAVAVSDAIDQQQHLLVQAGTGTGKSLAYLVPALAHLQSQENPIIVATATLALQNQIVKRDIPELVDALQDQLDHNPEVVVAKGRANYLCKLKQGGGYTEEVEEQTLFDTTEEKTQKEEYTPHSRLGKEVKRITAWAEETTTGERDELIPGVSDQAWQQFSVTARECVGSKCPFFEQCFVEIARNEAKDADIVVTNHAFLAAGTFGDPQILPEWDVAIIDEAHELVDKVTHAMSAELSISGISAAAQGIKKYAKESQDNFTRVIDTLNDYLHDVEAGLQVQTPQELLDTLNEVLQCCRKSLRESKVDGSTDANRQLARARVQEIENVCETIITGSVNGAQLVVWFSQKADSQEPAVIHCAPLDVGYILAEDLFADKTVIATSATLVLGDSFEFLAKALGFQHPDEFTAVDVGSPFNYEKQAILYVAKDLPAPTRGVSEEALEELKALIEASQGGALCLFSSRSAAEHAADWMRENIEFEILCQGEDSTPTLVKDFAADHHACLFGTLSLWQGVDVPGPSCRLVTIDRIPFPRPDDPLVNARARAANEAGGNGFMEVSATIAATRLAQGSGRLIRTIDDKGVVAILDSRLHTKRYGSFMRSAMPNFWYTTDQKQVLGALTRLSSSH
ncbi:MAG: ATP-dependent DNA helicase [Micrococcaceae bacterium]